MINYNPTSETESLRNETERGQLRDQENTYLPSTSGNVAIHQGRMLGG